MNGIVLLYHLNARATVLGNLVDIRSLHQAKTDIGMPEAIGVTAISISIVLQSLFAKDRIE